MQECPARVGVGWGELGMEMNETGWGMWMGYGWGCLRWQVKSSQVIVYSSSPDYCASSRPLPTVVALRSSNKSE